MNDGALDLTLKYGLNPQQRRARATAIGDRPLPLTVRNGIPSMLNLLDALQGWQLVRAAAGVLGRPVAASMKHVSPAGVAAAGEMDEVTRATFGIDGPISELASAYARARDTDPRSSYGDMVACSHPVDRDTAVLLARVVSDGIVAPGYLDGTVATLAGKKRGAFLVLEMDPSHVPAEEEVRDVFGVRIVQERDPVEIDDSVLQYGGTLPADTRADALLGLVAARHTQSNAVAYVHGGKAIGIGAGQQSRVDGIRLAGEKADRWRLRRHPAFVDLLRTVRGGPRKRVETVLRQLDASLDGAGPRSLALVGAQDVARFLAGHAPCVVASDAYLPFADNVEEAARHGGHCLVEGGGSRRSAEVELACRERGMILIRTGLRLFHH